MFACVCVYGMNKSHTTAQRVTRDKNRVRAAAAADACGAAVAVAKPLPNE